MQRKNSNELATNNISHVSTSKKQVLTPTMSENDDEPLSLESGIANHSTWNYFLNLITHFDFGTRTQANLEDEELGRL